MLILATSGKVLLILAKTTVHTHQKRTKEPKQKKAGEVSGVVEHVLFPPCRNDFYTLRPCY